MHVPPVLYAHNRLPSVVDSPRVRRRPLPKDLARSPSRTLKKNRPRSFITPLAPPFRALNKHPAVVHHTACTTVEERRFSAALRTSREMRALAPVSRSVRDDLGNLSLGGFSEQNRALPNFEGASFKLSLIRGFFFKDARSRAPALPHELLGGSHLRHLSSQLSRYPQPLVTSDLDPPHAISRT